MMNQIQNEIAAAGCLLAIDTSTSSMSVAILRNGRVLREINMLAERNHSVLLLEVVKDALEELGLKPGDLQGIAVGQGPGSYTGVRIGVTAAKTLAWALGLPVSGVSSLEAMAAGGVDSWSASSAELASTGECPAAEALTLHLLDAAKDNGSPGKPAAAASRPVWVVPVINARRGQAFTALFVLHPSNGQGWFRRQEDGIRFMEHWIDELLDMLRLETDPPAAILFTGETELFGPVMERIKREAGAVNGGKAAIVDSLPCGIQAQYAGYLAIQRLMNEGADDVHTLLPNYTQLAEAEVKLAAKKKQGE